MVLHLYTRTRCKMVTTHPVTDAFNVPLQTAEVCTDRVGYLHEDISYN